jgi:hypothetical protein
MAKKGIVQNTVSNSKEFVGNVFNGVGKFVKNVVPKSFKRSIRGGKSRKTRKTNKSRKHRK